ncbi:MAG: hypothetical protein ACYTGV_07310, partial [Planctomycetota bacterium]
MRSRKPLFAVLAALLVVPAAATYGAAPMPSRKFVHDQHGFLIKTIPGWERTPTQPGETIEVAKFKAKSRGTEFATLSIYRFGTGYGEVTPGPAQGARRANSGAGGARGRLEREVNFLRERLGQKAIPIEDPKT